MFPNRKVVVVVRGGGLTSHIPFFFCVNAPMCLLSHALVILVTYRDKGLPQLPKPGDFIERKRERRKEKKGKRQTTWVHVWKTGIMCGKRKKWRGSVDS